jgi:outer membrane protein assembly factor BamB
VPFRNSIDRLRILTVFAAVLGFVGATVGGVRAQSSAPRAESTRWQIAGRGHGRPAADDANVYFLSRDHEVVAVSRLAGTVRWTASTGEPGAATAGSTVLRVGQQVIAGDYNIASFDADTGTKLWTFSPQDGGYGPGYYLGSASGQSVFAGSPGGRLYAIDASSGAMRWSLRVSDQQPTMVYEPASDGELVVAGYRTFVAPSTGGLVAVSGESGELQWRATFPSKAGIVDVTSAGNPVFYESYVLAAASSGEIVAFDRSTGQYRWSLPELGPQPGIEGVIADFRPLTLVGRTLVIGSATGVVLAYDLVTRRELWRRGGINDGSVNFKITSDGDLVFVPYVGGTLAAIDAADGRVRWRTADSKRGFRWPPVVAGGVVYAAAANAGFFALER